MWNRKDLKARGKAAFKANYVASVIVALVLSFLTAGSIGSIGKKELSNVQDLNLTSDEATAFLAVFLAAGAVALIIGILVTIFITNPLTVGGYRFFVLNSEGQKPSVGTLLSAFTEGRFGQIFVTMFLKSLFLSLWSLLFIIPGVVKRYSYRMVPYLLSDHPDMSATEIITMSREMMKGNKWNAFVLDLSFILWGILSAVTLGIAGIFYVGPYIQATNAELYNVLKNQ